MLAYRAMQQSHRKRAREEEYEELKNKNTKLLYVCVGRRSYMPVVEVCKVCIGILILRYNRLRDLYHSNSAFQIN